VGYGPLKRHCERRDLRGVRPILLETETMTWVRGSTEERQVRWLGRGIPLVNLTFPGDDERDKSIEHGREAEIFLLFDEPCLTGLRAAKG